MPTSAAITKPSSSAYVPAAVENGRDLLKRAIHDHHLKTAHLVAAGSAHEKSGQLQWALDRFDFDHGRLQSDRDARADARRRIHTEMRSRGLKPREEGTPSTYRGTIAG